MEFSVIATIGPSLIGNPNKLKAIYNSGNCIFRINGAHADQASMISMTQEIRKVLPKSKIMVDLPGNKIRTHGLSNPIRLIKDEIFKLHNYEVNFPNFYKYLNPGDTILACDSVYKLRVIDIKGSTISLAPGSDGILETNKGLHVQGVNDDLPFLFPRDLELIEGALKSGIDIISLSYVRNAADVREVQQLLEKDNRTDIEIFAKIETHQAIENLSEILECVDTVNVDRGDLSADIGILNLPHAQEQIVAQAQKANKRIFLATQFLKNMELNPVPLISEVVDLHRTIKQNINGIQLSEETAVGKYPVECVKLAFDLYRGYTIETVSSKNEQVGDKNKTWRHLPTGS